MAANLEDAYIEEITAQYEEEDPARVMGRQMDAENEADLRAEEEEKGDLAYRQSPLATTGPVAEDYDYQGAYDDGVSLQPDEATGGVKLPNKHIKPHRVEIGGYDIQTLEQIRAEDDHNGYIRSGVQMLRESITDTVAGNPPSDMRGLTTIAYGIIERGGFEADFSSSVPMGDDDQKRHAWEAALAAAQRDQLEKAIDAGTILDLGDPDPDSGEVVWDSDKLHLNEGWLTPSATLYTLIEGEEFDGTPSELSEWAVDKMAAFEWNTAYLAWLTTRVLSSDEETQKAFYEMMNIYDNTDVNFSIVLQSAGSFAVDPMTWLGVVGGVGAGAVAKQAALIAAKNAVKHTLRNRVAKMMAKPVVAGAVLDAPIGAVEGGARDYAKQSVGVAAGEREEVDVGQVAGAAALEGGAGAVAGAGLSKAAPTIKWGYDRLKKLRWW